MKEAVLLTGATGFLGSYLLKKMLDEDFDVVVLKRTTSNTSRIKSLLPQLQSYDIDIITPEKIFRENKIDIILHAATDYGRKENSPLNIINANLILPLMLLHEGMKHGIKAFINTDTMIDKHVNHYSLSKAQFREWLKTYSGCLACVDVALEHFYGPYDDKTKFTSHIISSFLKEVPVINLTKGEQKRDFIYIDDVIDAFMLIIKSIFNSSFGLERFEIRSGINITIKDFVILVQKITNNKTTRLNFGALPYREHEQMESKVNLTNMMSLGWKPKITLKEGLAITIEQEKK